MKVMQRINEIIKAKNISKRELVRSLIELDMRASKTGEVPTESSIYAYLNGNIEIKTDMIPYIAEALDVCEQELFIENPKEMQKLLRRFHNNAHIYQKYDEIIQNLEYLSPKTIDLLKMLLAQNKVKIIEFHTMLEKILP